MIRSYRFCFRDWEMVCPGGYKSCLLYMYLSSSDSSQNLSHYADCWNKQWSITIYQLRTRLQVQPFIFLAHFFLLLQKQTEVSRTRNLSLPNNDIMEREQMPWVSLIWLSVNSSFFSGLCFSSRYHDEAHITVTDGRTVCPRTGFLRRGH